jgi:hypothetical protein
MNKLLPVVHALTDLPTVPDQVPLAAIARALEHVAGETGIKPSLGHPVTADALLAAGFPDDVAILVLAACNLLWGLIRASRPPKRPTAEEALRSNMAKAGIAMLATDADARRLFVLAAIAAPLPWNALAETAGPAFRHDIADLVRTLPDH